jgi:hypothetical protein
MSKQVDATPAPMTCEAKSASIHEASSYTHNIYRESDREGFDFFLISIELERERETEGDLKMYIYKCIYT